MVCGPGKARWAASAGLGWGLGRISASKLSAIGSRVASCGLVPSMVETNGTLLVPPTSPGPPPPSPGNGGTFSRLSTGSISV